MSWEISGDRTFTPKLGYSVRYIYCQNKFGKVEVGLLYEGKLLDPAKLDTILIGVKKEGGMKICLCLEYDEGQLWGRDNHASGVGEPLDGTTWREFFDTAYAVVNMRGASNKELYLFLRASLSMAERAPYLHIETTPLEEAL
jgi:hypothetical protein